MNIAESIMKICEASADACEASFYALRAFLMVFRSPPNSNGLAVSMSPARTNPPLTGTLAFSTFWWAGSLVVRESRHRRDRISDKNSRKRRRKKFGLRFFFQKWRACASRFGFQYKYVSITIIYMILSITILWNANAPMLYAKEFSFFLPRKN